MRRLLRSRKGLDYAAMLVLVVLVCLVYLYLQLTRQVDEFKVSVGESQVALLNAYHEGENALLYVDQAAVFSAYKALDEIASGGGVEGAPCSSVSEAGKNINAWSAKGMLLDDCFARVQPYDAFEKIMNGQLTVYLAKYPRARLPLNNYAVLVRQNSVTGTAIAPATVDLKPPTEIREWYVGPFKVAEAELKKVAIGEYAFWPSFTVNVETKLGIYSQMKDQVRALYVCSENKAVGACMTELKPLFTVVRSATNPDYLIATAKNPASSPFGELSDIVFALYLPEPPQP